MKIWFRVSTEKQFSYVQFFVIEIDMVCVDEDGPIWCVWMRMGRRVKKMDWEIPCFMHILVNGLAWMICHVCICCEYLPMSKDV